MKKFTAVVFILIMATMSLFGAEPIVKVPPLPDNLDPYEENEELFISKVLEYYDIAVALRSQILYLGETPKNKLPES